MLKYWLLASRPKTLVASLLPVVAGFLLAYEQSPNVSKVTGILCLLYNILKCNYNTRWHLVFVLIYEFFTLIDFLIEFVLCLREF